MIPRVLSLCSAVLIALSALIGPASAGNNPVVVELYTSQGCSSCPPADKLLHELADRDDVIALALHVDYWDYIGWKDKFADPAHSARQRAYAVTMGARSIYTPQMIVNGRDSIVGARAMDLADSIASQKQSASGVQLSITREASSLRIAAHTNNAPQKMVVHMLRYTPRREVKITRGENAGRQLKYSNVVQDWKVLREWEGEGALNFEAELMGDAPVVVLVQAVDNGPILAAARLR